MPTLDQHVSDSIAKLLLIGDTGEAKTGALASLAAVGYNIRILDLDNGVDALVKILREKAPDCMKNVIFETLTNKMKAGIKMPVIDGNPAAWTKAMKLLTKWEVGVPGMPAANGKPATPPSADYYNLGPVSTWGKQDILVIDSLTFLAKAAMATVLALNGRLEAPIQIQDYGEAMRMIESLLGMLYDKSIGCHVILISHIAYLGDEGFVKGFPMTIGQKLSPQVGRYFNNCFRCTHKGSGASIKRVIQTISAGNVDLKNSDPYHLPAEIPFDGIEGGLATAFQILVGDPPNKWPKASTQSATK